jgi:predicted  nucleic acid-binding Zn-ribbon protein
MNQPNEETAAQLKREHEAAKKRLESLREEARKLGHDFEEKLKPEILEAEVELTRLSGMLGQIGL